MQTWVSVIVLIQLKITMVAAYPNKCLTVCKFQLAITVTNQLS